MCTLAMGTHKLAEEFQRTVYKADAPETLDATVNAGVTKDEVKDL